MCLQNHNHGRNTVNKQLGQTLPLLFSYCTNTDRRSSWVNMVRGLGLDERTAVYGEAMGDGCVCVHRNFQKTMTYRARSRAGARNCTSRFKPTAA